MTELSNLALLHLRFLMREDDCGVYVAELRNGCSVCREIQTFLKENRV